MIEGKLDCIAMSNQGKHNETRPSRGTGSGVPTSILKLRPTANPTWESPRPVREGGPGGKYREREKKKKSSAARKQTLLRARLSKKVSEKEVTVEDLQSELEEAKSSLRLTQQLAASRLSDAQFLKAENNKLIIKNKKLNEEVDELIDNEREARRKGRNASMNLKAKEKLISKWKRKAEKVSAAYEEAGNELRLMEKEFLVLKIERANAMSSQVIADEKREEIMSTADKKMEEMRANHDSKMSYLTRELEDARKKNVELERNLQKTEAEASALQAATHKMEIEVESHFQQAKQMSKVERGEMQVEKESWKKAMRALKAENKDLWQQLQFLETVLLKGEQYDGVTPDNMTLPPVFGVRGKNTNRHERDLLIQKATEQRETKVRDLEVSLTEEKTKTELLAGRLSFAEETVHMLMLKNQELEEAVTEAVKTAHEFQDPKLHQILNSTSVPRNAKEPKSPVRQDRGNKPKRGGRSFRSGGKKTENRTGVNEGSAGVQKLRQDLEYLREVLREKSDLLVTSIAEQKKLSKQLTNQRELSTKYELAEKVMGRVTNRIQALKKHAKTEHVRLRSELALYGLFEDADISHDKHLNPEDLAFHIHERVDNLLLHAKEVWLEDAKADNNGSVVHDAASSLVPSFSVQLCKTQPIFYEVRRINKVNLMISVFEGEDPPHFDFEAYHPPTCGTFKVSCSLRQQRELLRRTPELVEDESRFEDRVEALMSRLAIISTPGRLEITLLDTERAADSVPSGKRWKKRPAVSIQESDAQAEFARLMGTGTQEEEIEKIKLDAGMILPDETATYADTRLFSSNDPTGDSKEMLNVAIYDCIDQTEPQLLVYCSDVGENVVRYQLTLEPSLLDTAVKDWNKMPRRRLCRVVFNRLRVDSQNLVLSDQEEERADNFDDDNESEFDENDDEVTEESGEYDQGEEAGVIAETIFYMLDRDGDNNVTKSEMMKAINQRQEITLLLKRNRYLQPLLNPKTWSETFKAIDASADGKISIEEFRDFAIHVSRNVSAEQDGDQEKPLVQLSKRIFEGDVRVLGGHDASLVVDQLGEDEIKIKCRIASLSVDSEGTFSTHAIDSAVPGWMRVWARADEKRKVDLITAGLSLTWNLDKNSASILMPGCSAVVLEQGNYNIDGESSSVRIIEHAGKSSRELSRLNIICSFKGNGSPSVANCNAAVQMSLQKIWGKAELSTTCRLECINVYLAALKKSAAYSLNWVLFEGTKAFSAREEPGAIELSVQVPAFDPRIGRLFIEGFDKSTSNQTSCSLLQTDEHKLIKKCQSRKWPDMIKTITNNLNYDGYTLAFDWSGSSLQSLQDVEPPTTESSITNAPVRTNATEAASEPSIVETKDEGEYKEELGDIPETKDDEL